MERKTKFAYKQKHYLSFKDICVWEWTEKLRCLRVDRELFNNLRR